MLKKILLLLCPLFCMLSLRAQDTIALKIGIAIPSKVLRVTDTVYYRMPGKDSGAVLRVMFYEVSYIRYADGTRFSYASKTHAQSRQVFLKLGYCISSEAGLLQNEQALQGYGFSIGYNSKAWGRKKKFRTEAGIGFLQKGGYVNTRLDTVIKVPIPDKIRLDYYTGDVSLRYYMAHYVYLKAGVGLSYRQAFLPEETQVYSSGNFNSFSAGFLYGAGIQSNARKAGILFEIIGQKDFTPLGIQSLDNTVYRNNSILFNFGVFLNLG